MRPWQAVIPEQERAVYEKAGWGKRQPFGRKPALLVIDVTIGFMGSRPSDVLQSMDEFATSCGEAGWTALPHIKRVLDACREKRLRVVYTRSNATAAQFIGGASKRNLRPRDPATIARGQQIPELIAPHPDEWILEKSRASAFFGTPLAAYLQQQGVDSVLVTGCVTSGCVQATVTDAFSHGFSVFVVEEGVFDRSETMHLVSLYGMETIYANVITVEEALEYVNRL